MKNKKFEVADKMWWLRVATAFYLTPTVLCWSSGSLSFKYSSEQSEWKERTLEKSCSGTGNRRSLLATIGASVVTTTLLHPPTQAAAAQEYSPSDEITIQISRKDIQSGGLGIELADIEFRTNLRVYIKSIAPKSRAESLGIQKDWIVVSLNGKSMERTNAAGVKQYLRQALDSTAMLDDASSTIAFTFRDPSVFPTQLQNLSSKNDRVATTQVAPAGDTTQRFADGSVRPGRSVTTARTDQRVTVEQLQAPRLCNRGATTDDLMEISYTGTVVETGDVFDGASVMLDGKGIPGRGGDTTIFFVSVSYTHLTLPTICSV